MNYPVINWEGRCPANKHNCRHTKLQHELLVSLEVNMLKLINKMVKGPTKDLNTQDLFITNSRSTVNKVRIVPGLSDHQAVLVEGNISPIIDTQAKRAKPL